ncbi:MAG TPA: anhydro-N-acetylmuramic acid kinase [Bacteroidia bacterium]|nr:anhydro-N-acetylmuramic acid kinase [Bacteroidia bacterium]HQW22376.1 anhydro-N-acetylmuramic acid kinase [Bacteroidia bacterium]
MAQQNYKVIGVMSGTSLDGVDLAYCTFTHDDHWSFKFHFGQTIPYDAEWKRKLSTAQFLPKDSLIILDKEYGSYLGILVKAFMDTNKIDVDFISSHGHTIFHQPKKGITVQIGSGEAIKIATGKTVVCDFRKGDVALGGQGAPLVPIGDKLLFSQMNYCLNLGGIANISFDKNEERIAFDICACNMVLNDLVSERGLSFDNDGEIASAGKLNKELMEALNEIPFYRQTFPKSLGREDVEGDVFPLLKKYEISLEDKLNTFCKHIAIQISNVLEKDVSDSKMLVTGGGTLNKFLLECIEDKCNLKIIIPQKEIIDFKEAIIFAFLGVLRMRNEVNCLKSVTGASADSSGGDIF